jgi:hypothetical protein
MSNQTSLTAEEVAEITKFIESGDDRTTGAILYDSLRYLKDLAASHEALRESLAIVGEMCADEAVKAAKAESRALAAEAALEQERITHQNVEAGLSEGLAHLRAECERLREALRATQERHIKLEALVAALLDTYTNSADIDEKYNHVASMGETTVGHLRKWHAELESIQEDRDDEVRAALTPKESTHATD